MTSSVLLLAILTATLGLVTFQAWRLGNERRDVALLAGLGALFGCGTAAAAFI